MSPNGVGGKGGGGGLERGGALLQKNYFQTGGLIREGRINSEVGFNRDFTVKQQPDYNFFNVNLRAYVMQELFT